ncbi:hypothetical protein GCM10009753_47930 [Streptantibioticus ferralitis]
MAGVRTVCWVMMLSPRVYATPCVHASQPRRTRTAKPPAPTATVRTEPSLPLADLGGARAPDR